MHYLMVMRNTHFRLIGPFTTYEAAGAWGCDPANNPADDPRWQYIRLADASAPVLIVPPGEPMPG